jgi:peptidoglycan/xylan/chitin deacetylase (PgdA/CDA1 family)
MSDARDAGAWSRRAILATAGGAVLGACGVNETKAEPPSPKKRRPVPTTSTAPATSTTAAPTGPATYIANGSRTGKAVALTFHGSGDIGLTQQLLTAARTDAVPLTIFGVGTWLSANPDLAHQIVNEGHTLGNHTYTHPDLGSLDAAAVADEIQRCASVLEQLEGTNGRWFRPSGIVVPTALILTEAGVSGYPVSVGYDVDPLDYEDPGSSAIVSRVTAQLRPGSIVSLHTGHAGTVEAFPALVALIRSRSLAPVVIGDLLDAK